MKRFNIDRLLGFIVFLGFSLYFYYLLSTGKINMFISTRMIKYTKASLIGLCLLTFYQFTKIFTIKDRIPISKSYILLFITIAIGFSASQKGINIDIAYKKGVSTNAVKVTQTNVSQTTSSNTENEIPILNNKGEVEFSDKNYANSLYELEENLNNYKGKKINIIGFVYREDDFKSDEFVVARMIMSCCAADAQVGGVMCNWTNTASLQKDEWISVEGTVDSMVHKDQESDDSLILPVIKVSKIENIKKPDQIYIYP